MSRCGAVEHFVAAKSLPDRRDFDHSLDRQGFSRGGRQAGLPGRIAAKRRGAAFLANFLTKLSTGAPRFVAHLFSRILNLAPKVKFYFKCGLDNTRRDRLMLKAAE